MYVWRVIIGQVVQGRRTQFSASASFLAFFFPFPLLPPPSPSPRPRWIRVD